MSLEYQENNRQILFSKISSEFIDGALQLCKIGMMADMKIATNTKSSINSLVEISMSIYFFSKIFDIIIIICLKYYFVLTGHVQHRVLLKASCS